MPRRRLLDYNNLINWEHPQNKGLIGWWKVLAAFSGGNQFIDLRKRNHGVYSNNPALSSVAHRGGFGSVRLIGTASQVINFGDKADFEFNTNQSHTIEFWFNGELEALETGLITKGYDGTFATNATPYYLVKWNSGGTIGTLALTWAHMFGGANMFIPDVTSGWHHVVCSYNKVNASLSLYLDGGHRLSTLSSGVTSAAYGTNSGPLIVGQHNNYYTGYFDGLRMYRGVAFSANDACLAYFESMNGHINTLNYLQSRTYFLPIVRRYLKIRGSNNKFIVIR